MNERVVVLDSDLWVYSYSSPAEAARSLEAVDVETGEYIAFRSDGTKLRLSIGPDGVELSPADSSDGNGLRDHLREALNRRGISPPPEENALESYVISAVKKFEQWEQSRSIWIRLRNRLSGR